MMMLAFDVKIERVATCLISSYVMPLLFDAIISAFTRCRCYATSLYGACRVVRAIQRIDYDARICRAFAAA